MNDVTDNPLNLDAEFYAELLRAYFDSANDAIFVLCDEMKFLVCNNEMQNWLGISEAELTSHNKRRPITELIYDKGSIERFTSAFQKVATGNNQRFECMFRLPDGEDRLTEICMNKVALDIGTMIIAVARDISEQHSHLELLRFQATHDSLTNLPNRTYLKQILTDGQSIDEPVAALIIDIARFKDINVALGHVLADSILQQTANRLETSNSENRNNIVGRLAGDQFVILSPTSDSQTAIQLAKEIQAVLSTPITISGTEISLDCRIGIALYPLHIQHRDKLLEAAESALHHAKITGVENPEIYDPDRSESGAERLTLINDLRHAINNKQIQVYFQPIIDLHHNTPPRVEALARWRHPDKGWIPPEQFIALAEMSGQITAITHLIIRTAIQQCAPLLRDNRITMLAINLSPLCLMDNALPQLIAELCREAAITPQRVTFEITEGAVMSEDSYTLQQIQKLKEQGLHLSIDDFGTGHSSLSKLKKIPLSELKIDRSFVTNMLTDENDLAISQAAINLAHTLNLAVVAEGIEDEATLHKLKLMGCEYAQGYFISKPVPFKALDEWLD